MNPLQQLKQLELNLKFPDTIVPRNTSSEEFIASRLSESPTGQIRLMESILERNNMRRAVRACYQEQGCPRCGRHDRPQNKEVPETSLDQD